MTKYVVNRSFNTSVERTERVLELAEGFGLGLSDKKFVIYDNLEIEINPGDVVYITGQSGSGKSLLLRDLTEKMREEGLKIADLNEIVLEDRPVIELVGKTITEATDLLAKAGISDAWIYIRKPAELSDGQKYRLKLAKMMESNADVWIADEFGAILDRVTAKAVAFNMQKLARNTGKTMMIATTHLDLKEEIGASLMITKRFQERILVETRQVVSQ